MSGILKSFEPVGHAGVGRALDVATTTLSMGEVERASREPKRVSESVGAQATSLPALNASYEGEAISAQHKIKSFQDTVEVRAKLEEPKRNPLNTPLEMLSVEVLAELRDGLTAIKAHEPRDHLVSISLRALELNGLQPQVTRVSTSGVATDLDLIGEGSERDTFAINSVAVPNSQASDDPLSFEAPAQSAIAKATAINSVALESGVRAVALPARTDRQQTLNNELGGAVYGNTGPVRATRLNEQAKMIINGADVGAVEVMEGDANSALRNAINALSQDTGVIASLNAQGELALETPDGRNISLSYEGSEGSALERSLGLRGSGAHPYGGRVALVSYRDVTLNLGRDVNYALGDVAGDFSVMDESYYSA